MQFYILVAFYIGLFIVYVSYQVPDVMFQYPNLENAGKVVYKDNDSCYKYNKVEVMCPVDNLVIISK